MYLVYNTRKAVAPIPARIKRSPRFKPYKDSNKMMSQKTALGANEQTVNQAQLEENIQEQGDHIVNEA